jgi:ubiquinone/menaquinone biosynthesis C-methylase UbiE
MRFSDEGAERDVDYSATNRSTYDRIASRYLENQTRGRSNNEHVFSELRDAFLGGLANGSLLADLGCGPGLDAARFVEEGLRVLGMDSSAGMLSTATGRILGRLVQADLRAIPIDDGRLDGIWCVAALLHVPERDTDQVVGEFRRTMRRFGNLALVTALGDSSRTEAVPYAPNERRWFVYRRRDQLSEQVRRAGFRIEKEGQIEGNRTWLTVLAKAV